MNFRPLLRFCAPLPLAAGSSDDEPEAGSDARPADAPTVCRETYRRNRSSARSETTAGVALAIALVTSCVALACSGEQDEDPTPNDGSAGNGGAVDPPGGLALCSLQYDQFNASPKVNTQSTSAWACTESTRVLTGNGIPDHAITGGSFATPMSPQSLSLFFPLQPQMAAEITTPFRQGSGYALNSVKFDPGTAGTCAATATSTRPGDGCDLAMGRDPWTIEALGGSFSFGTDENNGHTQPNGQYHYHGMPEGLLAGAGMAVKLVGFALDGFPVYARYGYSVATDSLSALKIMKGSWQLKPTADPGRPDLETFAMGTFTADYEYVAGSGDLDECNGRTGVTPEFPQGTYHYYITDTFPFIQRCVKGTLP
jgi:hypothetical protein